MSQLVIWQLTVRWSVLFQNWMTSKDMFHDLRCGQLLCVCSCPLIFTSVYRCRFDHVVVALSCRRLHHSNQPSQEKTNVSYPFIFGQRKMPFCNTHAHRRLHARTHLCTRSKPISSFLFCLPPRLLSTPECCDISASNIGCQTPPIRIALEAF